MEKLSSRQVARLWWFLFLDVGGSLAGSLFLCHNFFFSQTIFADSVPIGGRVADRNGGDAL